MDDICDVSERGLRSAGARRGRNALDVRGAEMRGMSNPAVEGVNAVPRGC